MTKWPMVPLGEVITQDTTATPVHADREYPNFGIYSFGRGLFPKPPISGATTSANNLYQVRAGQFIYSRLFAFEGAYGLVSEQFDGHFISNEYPHFNCDPKRIRSDYLATYFRWQKAWERAATLSTGMGDRRRRVQPEQLLKTPIPLPPLREQQQLVEYLDALTARIEEAKQLIQDTSDGFDELCRSILRDSTLGEASLTPVSELVRLRAPDVVVKADEVYQFAGVYCFGRGVFVGQHKSGMDFKYTRLTRLRTNDFVYPKLMAWEGALAVVPPECDGLVVSTEFPVFEIDQRKVLPEVLDVYFQTPSIWPKISGASTGTNVRRKRLNPTDFLNHRLPLPPMQNQLRLSQVKVTLETTKQSRLQTLQELNAIAKSVLDEAFLRGT